MKVLRLTSRILTGIVFMFSGTVKAIDPLGSAYKFHDYFQAFNLEFLYPFALPLSIVLCTAEFISGFSVLSGYRQKTGITGIMVLMLIFTPLTFILALTNPVSDCGCFGDAIHLSNWETFGKNIFLMIFAVILFLGRNHVKEVFKPLKEWILITITTILFVIFALLNLRYLPLIDFLPYKSGVNIAENMKIPEGMPVDQYETTFIYEKDGIEKEFTLENYPADDTTWKFIDQKSVLVRKGYQPPIHDFSINTIEGMDITEQILEQKGYTLLLISTKLENAHPSLLEKGFDLGNHCVANGISFYVVTASGGDVLKGYNNGLTFCTADETTLKTIVRANPGYLLINDGVIAGKWSWAGVPEKEGFLSEVPADHYAGPDNRTYKLVVITTGLSVIIVLLMIGFLKERKRRSFRA